MSNLDQGEAFSVNSAALGATLECGVLRYDARVTREWYTEEFAYGDPRHLTPGLMTDVELIPNEEDMINNDCQILPAFFSKVIFSRPSDQSIRVFPAAWMNVTNCSSTRETPLTITTMVLLSDKANDTIAFNTTGVLCRPRFSIKALEIVVNASTAETINITQSSNTSIPVDIGIDTTRLSGAINRGGSTSYEILSYEALVPYEDNIWMDLSVFERTGASHSPAGFIGRDPWFLLLSSANVSKIREYATNVEALAIDSSQLFQSIMAQIGNLAFRTTDSSPVPGFVKTREPRITIQRSFMFFLQSALGLLGITVICCATFLRPKSCLTENPATLAAVSVVVASSEKFQRHIENKGHLGEKTLREGLDGVEVRVIAVEGSKTAIEIQYSTVSLFPNLVAIPKQLLRQMQAQDPRRGSDACNGGYRPLMLYLVSRSCLLVAVTGTVVALGILLNHSSSQSGFDAQTTFRSLAWFYTPSAILVLLGYAIEGTSTCTQAVSSYMALKKGSVSGQMSLLFNAADHSAFAMFSYSYWQNIQWTFFVSSVITILYPIIKVVAAGLYIRVLGQHTFTAAIGIEQALLANLDRISVDAVTKANVITIASMYAVWTLTPETHFSSPPGTEGSLVFSNLTSAILPSDVAQALGYRGSLSTNVPAVQVDVNCSAYTSQDFQVIREGNIGKLTCKTQGCRRYFPELDPSALGLPVGTPLWPGGFDLSASPGDRYSGWVLSFDQAWADPEDYNLAPISGLFMEIDDYGPNVTSATQRFNITPKAIAGYSCIRSLNKVNVNVTFTRAIQSNLEGTSLLPMEITGYDAQSIMPANNMSPYSNTNVTMNYPGECVSSLNETCGLSTNWITSDFEAWSDDSPKKLQRTASSPSFLNIIAATQLQYQASNSSFLDRLFEPENLLEAAREAYTIFSTQIVNMQRGPAAKVENNTVQRAATINQQALRAVQSFNATITLMVLLSIVLGCIILAIWRVPSEPVVTKAPNSIAAQASLLAGSNLIRRLREEGANSVGETNIWNEEVFSMGWWTADEPQSGEEAPKERWGIDIGVARLRNTLEK